MISAGLHDRRGRAVTLAEVGDAWRSVADVVPRDDQREFVFPMAARYLLLSLLETDWHSLAVLADEQVVGHVMWGIDDDGSRWIGGLMVDAAEQGVGVGRAAARTLVQWLRDQPGCAAVRLASHPDNVAAVRMYSSLGFVATAEMDGDEVVFELRWPHPPDDERVP